MTQRVDKYALLPFEDYQRLLKAHEKAGSGIIAAKTLDHSNEGGLTESPPALNKQHAPEEKATPAASANRSGSKQTSKASDTGVAGSGE